MSCPSGCSLRSKPGGHDDVCVYTVRYCVCPTNGVDGGTSQFSAEGAQIDSSHQTAESVPELGSEDIEHTEVPE